ncbi:MAG: ArsR family transcriptional regulator [Chloroflexota bacterium]|nr:ArsR family transcriptional regulator [Chloroflexota bacterium]
MSDQTHDPVLLTNATLQNVHHTMLDGLGQLADYFGFSKVVGQLYGALLLSDQPLCLDDLVEQLDISKANASMNMRTLENMGMVRQVWVRGSSSRRKYYEAEVDFWQIIGNVLSGREMRDLDRAISVMSENVSRLRSQREQMSAEDAARAEVYIDRIEKMQALFHFAQTVIASILARTLAEGMNSAETHGHDNGKV